MADINDEQLAHAEIVQKETEDALGWWKDRALKAEAKLADKYLIEEQYEAACGDRDGLLRMVETLRGQKDRLEAERGAALSRARETEDGAVREAAEVIRTILTAHDARLSESGVLTYGPPSKGTGFVAAIQWLRRYDAARGGE